jgi:uncharacterized protein YndB with AHSA1/START domain
VGEGSSDAQHDVRSPNPFLCERDFFPVRRWTLFAALTPRGSKPKARSLLKTPKPRIAMSTFSTSREIPATTEQIFAAFSDPTRLSRWWGPAGFTSAFNVCEFKPGGRWSFVFHGPNGSKHPNECVFAEIESPRKIVIQHLSEPKYRLAMILAPSTTGTVVSWTQVFENPDVARRIEHIVVPANEQNLDRLAAEVLHKPDGG